MCLILMFTLFDSDQRQKAYLQQKQRLLDQQRMQFSGANTLQSNDSLRNKSQTNTGLYYKAEERKGINYDELAKLSYEGKKDFYDPSMKKSVFPFEQLPANNPLHTRTRATSK